MPQWNPSQQYRRVAAANQKYYARCASVYETTETHLNDPRAQRMLDHDLEDVLRIIGKSPNEVRALDACGGSGTVAVKLLKRGVDVTVCDISEELLALYKTRCTEMGLEASVVCADIGDYLANASEDWDLVVFSSALHHIEDIQAVLGLALARLVPGGLVLTVFDPTFRRGMVVSALVFLDYLAFKVHRQPRELPASAARRMYRTWDALRRRPRGLAGTTSELNDAYLGVLAEYHVERGIDDLRLVDDLTGLGFEVIRHDRYGGARYWPTRLLLSLLGAVTAFKLVLRRPA